MDLIDLVKSGKASDALENVGGIVSLFNPVIGGGIMLASRIVDSASNVSDDILEKNIIGVNGSAMLIDKMIESKNVDFDKLQMISDNLKSISIYMNKTSKMLG